METTSDKPTRGCEKAFETSVKEHGGASWTGSIWLRIWTGGGFL
jgi:hypothetical protein